MAEQVPTTSDATQPRRKLGKYELVERFERGGMATVYKAYDPTLDRYVAIKQIAPHLADDPRFVERFRHEAQVLAKLGDEATHVVVLHELVEDDAGGFYIVMEYVEGKTLEAYLKSAPIAPVAASKLMAQIASGLRAVHHKGIIHRDIKPQNIILTPQGRVKITDFGLAARAGGSTSMSMGTTKYMAPELFRGGPIDARADLYSLGFMMYELLCPIDRFNEIFEDVLHDEQSEGLRWMSWHADRDRTVPPLIEVNPRVPKRLSALVQRLMQKDADQRLYSADEVLAELRAAFGKRNAGTTSLGKALEGGTAPAEGEAVVTLPPAEGQPVRKGGPSDTARLPVAVNWTKRLIIIGAGVVVLIIGLVVVKRIAGRGAREAADIAKASYDQAKVLFEQGKYEEAAQKYAVVLDKVGKTHPNADIVVDARQKYPMAQAYVLRDQKRWKEAEDKANEAKSRAFDSTQVLRFMARMEGMKEFWDLLDQAQAEAKRGEFDVALKTLDKADDKAAAAYPTRPPDLVLMRSSVLYQKGLAEGDAALAANNFEAAETAFAEAQKALGSAPPPAELAERLNRLRTDKPYHDAMKAGREASQKGDYATAIARFSEAREIKAGKEIDDLILDARYQQAMEKGKQRETARNWKQALDEYLVAKGIKDTPEVQIRITAMQSKMTVQDLRRQADQARRAGDFQKAIDLYLQVAQLEPDPQLDKIIKDCRYQLHYTKALALERDGKLTEALVEANQTKAETSTPEVDDALILRLQQRIKYNEFVRKGDGLMAPDIDLPDKALEMYREAQKVIDDDAIKQKSNEAQYRIFMKKGKEREEADDFNTARVNYETARSFKSTPEVVAAIERVKKKMLPG